MSTEHSYGIVPLKQTSSGWQVLFVQPHYGFWGLPKGHGEKGESPKQAAERELEEETNLIVTRYLPLKPFEERYSFTKGKALIQKIVLYFPAEVQGTVALQKKELQNSAWIPLKEAADFATYEETKRILKTINIIIENIS